MPTDEPSGGGTEFFDLNRSTTVLVRKTFPAAHWELWSQHDSDEEGAEEVATKIAGRGITAWSWWGPTAQAAQMLLDPSLTGD